MVPTYKKLNNIIILQWEPVIYDLQWLDHGSCDEPFIYFFFQIKRGRCSVQKACTEIICIVFIVSAADRQSPQVTCNIPLQWETGTGRAPIGQLILERKLIELLFQWSKWTGKMAPSTEIYGVGVSGKTTYKGNLVLEKYYQERFLKNIFISLSKAQQHRISLYHNGEMIKDMLWYFYRVVISKCIIIFL